VRFAQYDEMVETFPSDRPDQSFRKTVLPRRAASDGFVTDAHSSHAACNHRAVDTVPITDQIAWSLVPRECLADLASNPLGSGICGDGNPGKSSWQSVTKRIEPAECSQTKDSDPGILFPFATSRRSGRRLNARQATAGREPAAAQGSEHQEKISEVAKSIRFQSATDICYRQAFPNLLLGLHP
jgi:hypothetical protein